MPSTEAIASASLYCVRFASDVGYGIAFNKRSNIIGVFHIVVLDKVHKSYAQEKFCIEANIPLGSQSRTDCVLPESMGLPRDEHVIRAILTYTYADMDTSPNIKPVRVRDKLCRRCMALACTAVTYRTCY